jgi:hypothetical protein
VIDAKRNISCGFALRSLASGLFFVDCQSLATVKKRQAKKQESWNPEEILCLNIKLLIKTQHIFIL